ncbi:signal peptidase II [Helicobacter sp. T3_23-1059]
MKNPQNTTFFSYIPPKSPHKSPIKSKIYAFFKIVLIIAVVICIDQFVKGIILDGFRFSSEVISIVLVHNDGVAFSMLANLGEYLKWLQVGFLLAILLYLLCNSEAMRRYFLGLGLIMGGGISNVIDRFIHGAVVDFVHWHYGFEFAIFNVADVCIDAGVAVLIVQWLWLDKKQNQQNSIR